MFEDWAVVALDVPAAPVDLADLRAFLHRHADGCAFTGTEIRHVTFEARKPVVDGEPVLHGPQLASLDPHRIERFDWDPVFEPRFRDLCTWFEELPFVRLDGLTFVTQTRDVHDHLDVFGDHSSITYYEANRRIEPAFYRAIFADEGARDRSFYVTETYEGTRRFVTLPPDRQLAAVSTSTVYHGAVHRRGFFKTTAVPYGILDEVAHHELLARSLARFPDHAVRLTRPGPVQGPGAVRPYRPAHET